MVRITYIFTFHIFSGRTEINMVSVAQNLISLFLKVNEEVKLINLILKTEKSDIGSR